MNDMAPTIPSLAKLLILVTSRPKFQWPELTDADTVSQAFEAALGDESELRSIRACYPDQTLRAIRLNRFAQTFAVPQAFVDKLLAAIEALPPPPEFPESPEIGDWAWDRRRELRFRR